MDDWQMFGKTKDVEIKKSPIFKEYIVPLGTLLLAILSLFAKNVLPWWGSLAIVIYIAIVAVFLVVPVVNRSLKNWKARTTHARLEKKYYPEVIEALHRFKPMVDSSRSDTLWGVWKDSGRTVDTQKHIRPNYSHFEAISAWHIHLSRTADSAKSTDFQFIAAEVASWVQQYVAFCRDAYSQFESLIRDKQCDESLLRQTKQNWNHVRDEHNKAISNWLALSEKINESFGQKICPTHYETLRPLE